MRLVGKMITSWKRMICRKKYLRKNLEKSGLEPVDFKVFLGHTPTPTLQKKPTQTFGGIRSCLVCTKSPTTALLIANVRYMKVLTQLRGFLVKHVYLWFGFLRAQVRSGNCQTMES